VDFPVALSSTNANIYDGGYENHHSTESSEALSELLPTTKNTKQATAMYIPASDGQKYHTALRPPPLHHKGVVRSEVLYMPDDKLGTCL
jgi:hypothetical protein